MLLRMQSRLPHRASTPPDSNRENSAPESGFVPTQPELKIKQSAAEKKVIRSPSKSGTEADFFVHEASRIIRAEMERRGISFQDLLDALEDRSGEEAENRQALINKISRGKFSFAFVLRLCEAMKITSLNVTPVEPTDPKFGRRF